MKLFNSGQLEPEFNHPYIYPLSIPFTAFRVTAGWYLKISINILFKEGIY